MSLASRVCALGSQPGIIAGISNLPWLNAVPSVCTSGLSMSIDVLETDELNTILGDNWVKQAPLRLCGNMGYLWKTAVLPCQSTWSHVDNWLWGEGWMECLQLAAQNADNPGLHFSLTLFSRVLKDLESHWRPYCGIPLLWNVTVEFIFFFLWNKIFQELKIQAWIFLN